LERKNIPLSPLLEGGMINEKPLLEGVGDVKILFNKI